VEWSFLNVPWERRIQTTSILLVILMPWLLIYLNVVLFFLPFLWFLHIAYLVWVFVFDKKASSDPSRMNPWMRRLWFWRRFREYFPSKLIKTADLDPSKPYLFGLHPHGIISYSAQANFSNDYSDFANLFPGVKLRTATLASNFNLPITREWLLGLGYVDASRSTLLSLMKRHYSVMIVIGGAEEALYARPGATELVLQKRKGFVRLAMQAGASLVPTYGFGENDLFDQVANPPGSFVRKAQEWGKEKLGFSIPLYSGRGIFNYNYGMLPHRQPLTTVVGAPIDLPHIAEPTDSQVDEYHAKYMEGLEKLFEEWKSQVPAQSNLTEPLKFVA